MSLPFIRNACDGTPAIAIEASGRRRTAADINLVADVGDIESKPPILHFVVDRRVADHVRRDDKAVGRIGIGNAIVTDTGAEAEARQRSRLERVIAPQRRDFAGCVGGYRIDQRRIEILADEDAKIAYG